MRRLETIEVAEIVDGWRSGGGRRIRSRLESASRATAACCGAGSAAVLNSATSASTAALGAHAAADEHAAEEDDHRHDRRGHEQEHQLLTIQLDLVEAVVLGMCSQSLG